MQNININDYDYYLPDDRIAQYPVRERDNSRLLLYDGQNITSDIFRNIDRYLPGGSLLVFNNTRVIRARLLFHKASGAVVEILCLEPSTPQSYEESLGSKGPVEWKCIIGNLKKWKTGTLSMKLRHNKSFYELVAEKVFPAGEAWIVRFRWNNSGLNFGEVLAAAGHIPLPPYITREDEKDDSIRYQTVYSSVNGSVAAPTAGLHFTDDLLKRLSEKGIRKTDITLHVGAGTFQPVRTSEIKDHIMHREHFFVTNDTISELIRNHDSIISVGTTSVRTIESLYWLGIKVINNSIGPIDELTVEQWEPYSDDPPISAVGSLSALLSFMAKNNLKVINASTGIIIVPGYKFRLTNGIITNFHQPRSTLLLLISAWTGLSWKKIYKYAIENNFRFLSYGDSSLLFR